jgi:hypothetical protein
MKTFLLFLTLFAFLQSAFLPINLVLVILIARALVVDDRDNLILAFSGGLILSFLTQVNLGYYPLIFMLVVKLISMIKKLPISFNLLIVFISGGLLVTLVALINSWTRGEELSVYLILIEAVLVIPVYIITKLWEERFIVISQQMKLRV